MRELQAPRSASRLRPFVAVDVRRNDGATLLALLSRSKEWFFVTWTHSWFSFVILIPRRSKRCRLLSLTNVCIMTKPRLSLDKARSGRASLCLSSAA